MSKETGDVEDVEVEACPDTPIQARPEDNVWPNSGSMRWSWMIKKLKSKTLWTSFLMGQVCSLLLCGMGVTTTYLVNKGVNAPTAQSFLNYILIGAVYAAAYGCKPNGGHDFMLALRKRWWWYAILGVIDVEANYLMVKAYNYTTMTSVQLLDCVTIPTVLILSCAVLKYRFRLLHYLGVGMCVGGAIAMVFGDIYSKKSDEDAQNRLIGDFMVFGGAILYGLSNVSEEYIVKTHSRLEFLSMLGLFGSLVSGIQLVALERHELQTVDWSDWEISAYLILFGLFLFALYSLVPYLMRQAGASIFNMSILSADFYALLVGMTLFGYQFHYFYFIGFVLVVSGLVTYSIQSPVSKFEDRNRNNNVTTISSTPLSPSQTSDPVPVGYTLEVHDDS